MKNTNYRNIKQFNRNAVYKYLYRQQPQARQDIAYALNMSLPTVTQNLRELEQEGLVMESGEFESTGGRKAAAIEINYEARYAIGLDITQNHIGAVLIDLNCRVIFFKRIPLKFRPKSDYFKNLQTVIENVISEADIPEDKILGVGIGVPAIVDLTNQFITYGPLIDYTGGTLKEMARYIKLPVIMYNDANAAGFAELWNTNKNSSMLYLSLSNSVGGSILINSDNFYGDHYRGGEFGHMTVRYDGPLCFCGQRGCLDALCNAQVLFESVESKRLEDFFIKLDEKSPTHLKIWDTYLDDLALASNNLRMAFDIDIVMGGYVGGLMEPYLDTLREKSSNRNTFERNGDYIDICQFKFEATAVGAALYWIDDFINKV